MPTKFVDGRDSIFGGDDVIPLEAPFKLRKQPGIIFNNQQISAFLI
jgi:hypothetical protein